MELNSAEMVRIVVFFSVANHYLPNILEKLKILKSGTHKVNGKGSDLYKI